MPPLFMYSRPLKLSTIAFTPSARAAVGVHQHVLALGGDVALDVDHADPFRRLAHVECGRCLRHRASFCAAHGAVLVVGDGHEVGQPRDLEDLAVVVRQPECLHFDPVRPGLRQSPTIRAMPVLLMYSARSKLSTTEPAPAPVACA